MSLSGGITLSTNKNTATIKMAANDTAQTVLDYELSISKFSYHKKMYQPTKIVAEINIVPSTGKSNDYQEIGRKALEDKFKHAQVTLTEGTFSIGDDFYVHEVLPHYGKDSMSVTLKIYSLDKLLTVEGSCRTFVAKKLGADILATEITKYIKPWTSNSNTKEAMTYSADGMQILKYEKDKEHIFPYLVQYNESFYDLLARTTNRWGEFLYYEGGKLNIGYDATAEPIEVKKKDIEDISFGGLNDKSLILTTDGSYDYEADNSSLAGEPIQKSPYYVRGQMVDFGGVPDKWVMKQFPGIFMNDKNLPTLMTNLLFDNWYYLCMKEGRTAKRNADHDERYFKDRYGAPEQYDDKYTFHRDYDETEKVTASAFQEFTELNTKFTGEKYKEIVEKELTSGRNAIYINYGTTNPHLRLGSIITFGGKKYQYIVVDISGSYDANQNLVFKVVATAKDKDKDERFYPAVIPSGHVRFAHPQVATITDAKDSTRRNRVRVMFSWEAIVYDKKGEITEDNKKLSSPWLTFASSQQGHPMAGKHYEGDHVMVGFQEGNVERPYVIGGLAEEDCRHLNIDSILTSRGMHKLILSDGTGAGMQAFLGGAVSPLSKTFMNFAPGVIPFLKWDKTKYFEGGFELSDYYGIYRITGTTDGRNVTIASNWGDVKINSFTGINISSPNGDVNISGKNVTIEAGNNLTLESGTNIDYKLWKSKESTKSTAAQFLTDTSPQVDKRLAEVGHPLDLSIVRSAVEIFFRPVEGSLTVKSNRFLKLEAGNSCCHLPTKAYSVETQKQLQDEAGMKTGLTTIAYSQDLPILFDVLRNISLRYMQMFRLECEQGVYLLSQIDLIINELKNYANNPNYPVCITYEKLKDKLWSQTEDVNWTERDYFFGNDLELHQNVAWEAHTWDLVQDGPILPNLPPTGPKYLTHKFISPHLLIKDFISVRTSVWGPISTTKEILRDKLTDLNEEDLDDPKKLSEAIDEMWYDAINQQEEKDREQQKQIVLNIIKNLIKESKESIHNTYKYSYTECIEILLKRKNLQEKYIKTFNKIRKLIFKLTHYQPSVLKKLVKQEYSKRAQKAIPETYMQMILSAISREKCPKAACYDIPEKFKDFRHHHSESGDALNETIYLQRLSAMNLLDALGFTDDVRDVIDVSGEKPPKPQADKMDAGDGKNIMNENCWQLYVWSLQALPPVSKDMIDSSQKADPSFLKAQLDKIDFLKGAKEIKNWGEGKDGQILFGSGKDTYALNDCKFEKVYNPILRQSIRDIKDILLEISSD